MRAKKGIIVYCADPVRLSGYMLPLGLHWRAVGVDTPMELRRLLRTLDNCWGVVYLRTSANQPDPQHGQVEVLLRSADVPTLEVRPASLQEPDTDVTYLLRTDAVVEVLCAVKQLVARKRGPKRQTAVAA